MAMTNGRRDAGSPDQVGGRSGAGAAPPALDPAMVADAMRLADEEWHAAQHLAFAPPARAAGPRSWFVLITVSRGEKRAKEGLLDAGFEVYIPIMVDIIRHHRSHKLIRRAFPLFNRYIFAELPCDTRQWGPVHAVKELAGALGEDGRPRPVDAAVVEEVRRRELKGEFDNGGKGGAPKEYGLKRFPVGSYARATQGAFGGFAGRVESIDGKGMVRVLVGVFNRLTPVEFDPDHLEPV